MSKSNKPFGNDTKVMVSNDLQFSFEGESSCLLPERISQR